MKENLTIHKTHLEINPDNQIINKEQDLLDIIGFCFDNRKLIIHQNNLDPKFFDLSTKFAGDILQKLVNYQIKTAFIIDTKSIKSEKFKELIYETNGNDDYRFFDSKEAALEWLITE